MATGRIRRSARRGVAALALSWLAVMAGSVLLAPGASAAPTATVDIKDLTPPLVSVDAGGTVTFTNQIADKSLQVGGGGLLPSLVTAVVHTDVALGLPSGSHPLQPGQKVAEKFAQSCLTCSITYTYRVTVPDSSIVGGVLNTVTANAVKAMPQSQVVTYNGQQTTVAIGVPTPFLVNTLLPLPNLPGVNLPQVPKVTVPPLGGSTPVPGGGGGGGTTVPGGTTPVQTTTTTTTVQGVPGTIYSYNGGLGAAQMAPTDRSAGAAFDPTRFGASGKSSSSYLASGSGGQPGSYDGASVPVFGELAGLNGTKLDNASAASPTRNGADGRAALPVPALVAVVALAGVFAALVRTHQANRAHRAGRAGR